MTPPSIPQSRQRRRRYRQWNLITAMSRRRRSSGRPFSLCLFFFCFLQAGVFLFVFISDARARSPKQTRKERAQYIPHCKSHGYRTAPEEETTEWIGVKPLRGGTLARVSFGWRQLSSSTTTTKPFLTTPPRLVEWSDSTSTAMSVSLISAFEFRSQRRPRTGI